MARYRILGGTPDADGTVELPDDAKIIGALYHPQTGELNVVMLQEVPAAKPGEGSAEEKAAKEKTAESVIHLGPKKNKEAGKEAQVAD